MLGDTAVAVNPNDTRYKKYIGKKVVVPIVERKVKIIADKYVEIEQGSGVLKVTPAHDINDYKLGETDIETPDGLTKATPLLEKASNIPLSYSFEDMFYGFIPDL